MRRKIAMGVGVFALVVLAVFSTQMSSFLISDTYVVEEPVRERIEIDMSDVENYTDTYYTRYQVSTEDGNVLDESEWSTLENSNNVGSKTSQNLQYEFSDKITSDREVLYIDFTLDGANYNNTNVQSIRHYDNSEGSWNDVTNKLIATYSKEDQLRLHFWGKDEGIYWSDAKKEEYQLGNYIEGTMNVGTSGTVGNSLNYVEYNIPEGLNMNNVNVTEVGLDSDDWDKKIDQGRYATSDITGINKSDRKVKIDLAGNYNIKQNDRVIVKFEGLSKETSWKEYSDSGKVNSAPLDISYNERTEQSTWDTFQIRERDKVEVNLQGVENPQEAGTYLIRQRFLTHGEYSGEEGEEDGGEQSFQEQTTEYKYRGREIDDREYALTIDNIARDKVFQRSFDEEGVYEYRLQIGDSEGNVLASEIYDFKVYESGDPPAAFSELENFFSSNFLDGFFSMFSFA